EGTTDFSATSGSYRGIGGAPGTGVGNGGVPGAGVGVGIGAPTGGATIALRKNQLLSAPGVTPPLNRKESNAPGVRRPPANANAVGVVVPPLMALTTRMPLLTVSAPGPPVLRTKMLVEPEPLPPLMISWFEGEPSVPRKVLSPMVPPVPL